MPGKESEICDEVTILHKCPSIHFVPYPPQVFPKEKVLQKVHMDMDMVVELPKGSVEVDPSFQEAKVDVEKVHPQHLGQGAPTSFFLRVRNKLKNWLAMGAPAEVRQLILHGVGQEWPEPALTLTHQQHTQEQAVACMSVIQEYIEAGALREVSLAEAKFLVPWFLIEKQDPQGDMKVRLITDCRLLNQFLITKTFKLDHLNQIFPFLRKGMWAAKIDLKHAYFHLELAAKLKPYVCIEVGQKIFQFQAACFGLSTLPQQFMSLMKVLLKHWRSKGMLVFVYLDDILVISNKKCILQHHQQEIVQDLTELGLVINTKKSQLEPTQLVQHLGFQLDFKEGRVNVPPEKLKAVRKELGKLITKEKMSARKMAAILGTVRSFLTALPFLRAFTDQMRSFVSGHHHFGWDKNRPIPLELQEEVRSIKNLLHNWSGRQFVQRAKLKKLQSDASQIGWGGLNTQTGEKIHEFWRDQKGLHINIKELHAAIHTVQSLAKRKEQVHLTVDNVVAYTYLKKGGEDSFIKFPPQTVPTMVHGQSNSVTGKLGKIRSHVGRPHKQMVHGQGGLHPQKRNFFLRKTIFSRLGHPHSRYVCQSRQPSTSLVCLKMASLGSNRVQCLRDGFNKHLQLLCQPPMDSNSSMASTLKGKSTCHLFDNSPLLGWKHLVAPTNKNACEAFPNPPDSTTMGVVHKLPGGKNASYKMAPSLCSALRQIMETKQIPTESIENYLTQVGRNQRYDRAFRTLWAVMKEKQLDPLTASIDQIASILILMDKINTHEARNAFAACLLFPGMEMLRFVPIIKPLKKKWNVSLPKYADFWDASRLFVELKNKPIDWNSIVQVRNRLIIIMRLVHLMRSVDLARTFRCISIQDGKHWILLQRKGAVKPQWEEVMQLHPPTAALCTYSCTMCVRLLLCQRVPGCYVPCNPPSNPCLPTP